MKTALFLAIFLIATAAYGQTNSPATRWWKGNTHTHTNRSDGDSDPRVVVQWYKDHGYNFLVLTDHNIFVNPREFADLQDENFILIPGEELSASHNKKPIHVNALNIDDVVAAVNDRETTSATIQANIDVIRAGNGVPHINHPNFRWAISHLDLLKLKNYRLLEIHNGHPQVNNLGGSGYPAMEEVWDYLLTAGQRVYGIAVDDAHHFTGEFAPHRSNPGRGWLHVRTESLEPSAIMEALENGDFYASSGVELADIRTTKDRMEIEILPARHLGYRTEFIGADGRVLLVTDDNPAVYECKGTELYVRARVRDSMGRFAWVQPLFINSNKDTAP